MIPGYRALNMMQEIQQTREEKIKMYMELSKEKLAELLCNCNDILAEKEKQYILPEKINRDLWAGNWPGNWRGISAPCISYGIGHI